MNHSKSGPFENGTKIDHSKSGHVRISDPTVVVSPNHWSGLNGGIKLDKNVWFMVLNIWYSNGPPNHLIRPFVNRTKSV